MCRIIISDLKPELKLFVRFLSGRLAQFNLVNILRIQNEITFISIGTCTTVNSEGNVIGFYFLFFLKATIERASAK